MAVLILWVLVTVKSSPTIWIAEFWVMWVQASQSSWSKGSYERGTKMSESVVCYEYGSTRLTRLTSMETMGYFSTKLL